MDGHCFERIVQMLEAIVEDRNEKAREEWRRATFSGFITYLVNTSQEDQRAFGIRTFPEFLRAFGIEEEETADSDLSREELQEEISEAYQIEQKVLLAFGSLGGPGGPMGNRPATTGKESVR